MSSYPESGGVQTLGSDWQVGGGGAWWVLDGVEGVGTHSGERHASPAELPHKGMLCWTRTPLASSHSMRNDADGLLKGEAIERNDSGSAPLWLRSYIGAKRFICREHGPPSSSLVPIGMRRDVQIPLTTH